MNSQIPQSPSTSHQAAHLRAFAEDFFRRFGAEVYPDEHEILVGLPPELAEVFGKPRLYLVFPAGEGEPPRELSPNEDLLVYGSRTFDLMLGLLAERGQAVQLRLAERFSPQESIAALPLHNCHLDAWTVETTAPVLYCFNFRLIYKTDERQERVETVMLDQAGRPQPMFEIDWVEIEALAEVETWPVEGAELARLLDEATAVVQQRAEAAAEPLLVAAQSRLEKTAQRLSGYYRRLLDEIDPADPEKAAALKAGLHEDLQRKLADEITAHQLQLTIEPISYAVVVRPLADYQVTLAAGQTRLAINLTQNLYNGQFTLPLCHHSGQQLESLAVCAYEHLVQPAYLDRCAHCGHDVCQACGLDPCALSGQLICSACVAICIHCDRWLAPDQVQSCAACGWSVCAACAQVCPICELSQCPAAGCGLNLARDEACHTCHQAQRSLDLDHQPEPLPADLKPARYTWQGAGNEQFKVYLGRSFFFGGQVIVVDSAGQILSTRRVGFWQRRRGRW